MVKKIGKAVLVLCLGVLALPAQAAVFDWKITGGFSGSGTLTATDQPYAYNIDEPPTGQSVPGYLVTSMTGKFGGLSVSLVAADPEKGPYFASNLIYPTGTKPMIDENGLLFKTATRTYNLFASRTCGGDTSGCSMIPLIGYPGISGGSKQVAVTITAVKSAVPESATWVMMILGFGVVGYAMRRKPALQLV
ncbi:PEPxxWA-CTERM sorting domain-containing protein [Sphingomonas phyllosphaerae]|uniref:PEPxxWA-CTERM sorting domain-containing protein n=1 Tax=Sphingomonas phyllosphaerae TaxID=257003 RepID=UPI0012DDAAA6|nr:PEPxxWA-CTERM sorting domain-containing protein [Sphingomonas phyllosphaerae]